MASYVFRATLVDGRIVEVPLDQPLTISAEDGAVYAVLDAETHAVIEHVKLKQENDSLVIAVEDEQIVQIDNFYDEAQQVYFNAGLQTASGEPLLLASSSAVAEASDMVWEAADTNAADGDFSSTGVLLLLVGGAGVATFIATQNNDTPPAVVAPPAPIVADSTIVVFDLVNGVSSDHSGRTFDPNVAYSIYIMVADNTQFLNTATGAAQLANGNSWGIWSGGENLGLDDTIILVGEGGPMQGANALANATPGVGLHSRTIWGTGSITTGSIQVTAAGLFSTIANSNILFTSVTYGMARFTRATSAPSVTNVFALTNATGLWTATAYALSFAARPNADVTALSQVYAPALPAGILTSQGLV